MELTKEDVVAKIESTFDELINFKEKVMLNNLIQKTGFKSSEKLDIFNLFGIDEKGGYAKLIDVHTKLMTFIPEDSTTNDKAVKLKDDIKFQNNANEEKENTVVAEVSKMTREKAKALLQFLNDGLYEKEEIVRLAFLSVISGQSLFLLGPPGTAKSMIARKLSSILKKDASNQNESNNNQSNKETPYFEYLLNEFSTPDEIFGPVSLKELENDNYMRKVEGFLPNADIAFLDEIWKAGPAILNTLLTIINERKFHNGSEVLKTHLKALIAASNELPAKNKGLEALWDRFILRVLVNPIDTETDFFKMVKDSNKNMEDIEIPEEIKKQFISVKELEKYNKEIDNIEISEQIENLISAIRKELQLKNNEENREDEEKYYISDRRWKKIVHILRTSAYANGRYSVDIMDASLIEDCIWSTKKQREEVRGIVEKLIQEEGLECNTAINDINEQIKTFDEHIMKTWYEKKITKAKKAEPIIVTRPNTNEEYYEVSNDSGNKFYFAIKIYDNYYGEIHQYFDSQWKNERTMNYVKIESKTIKSNNIKMFTINYTKEEKGTTRSVRNNLFDNPEAYKSTKQTFDTNKYKPIADNIQIELENLNRYKQEKEKPFKENLFADQRFSNIILSKIDSAKQELENAQIKLDKSKFKYEQ